MPTKRPKQTKNSKKPDTNEPKETNNIQNASNIPNLNINIPKETNNIDNVNIAETNQPKEPNIIFQERQAKQRAKKSKVDSTLKPNKKINRAPNAFILFSNDLRPELRQQNPSMSAATISKLLGEKWRLLHPDKKEAYRVQADLLKSGKGAENQGSFSRVSYQVNLLFEGNLQAQRIDLVNSGDDFSSLDDFNFPLELPNDPLFSMTSNLIQTNLALNDLSEIMF